jgi:hypothetical protein
MSPTRAWSSSMSLVAVSCDCDRSTHHSDVCHASTRRLVAEPAARDQRGRGCWYLLRHVRKDPRVGRILSLGHALQRAYLPRVLSDSRKVRKCKCIREMMKPRSIRVILDLSKSFSWVSFHFEVQRSEQSHGAAAASSKIINTHSLVKGSSKEKHYGDIDDARLMCWWSTYTPPRPCPSYSSNESAHMRVRLGLDLAEASSLPPDLVSDARQVATKLDTLWEVSWLVKPCTSKRQFTYPATGARIAQSQRTHRARSGQVSHTLGSNRTQHNA